MNDTEPTLPKRLVLCFDGTGVNTYCCTTDHADSHSGNKFLGNESDTNIVKIYQMLDRKSPDQYHYYQRKSSQMLRKVEAH